MPRNFSRYGFWTMLGFAAGMLVSNVTTQRSLRADGMVARYEEFLLATGKSMTATIDLVWLLDYEGAKLICVGIDPQNGQLAGMTSIDLGEALKLEGGNRAPHFLMVTGRFEAKENSDLLYLVDTTSEQFLVVAAPAGFDPRNKPLGPPRVIARFKFRGDTTVAPGRRNRD